MLSKKEKKKKKNRHQRTDCLIDMYEDLKLILCGKNHICIGLRLTAGRTEIKGEKGLFEGDENVFILIAMVVTWV